MIHHYSAHSEDEDTFLLEFEIRADATFSQLLDFLIDTLGFDPASVGMFYLCDDRWHEIGQVASRDFFDTDSANQYDIDHTYLEELLDETGARLRYLYDPFEDRYLRLQLVKIHSGSLEKPKIIALKGKQPKQTNLDEFVGHLDDIPLSSRDTTSTLIDESFDDDLFNADELSSEGFSIFDEE